MYVTYLGFFFWQAAQNKIIRMNTDKKLHRLHRITIKSVTIEVHIDMAIHTVNILLIYKNIKCFVITPVFLITKVVIITFFLNLPLFIISCDNRSVKVRNPHRMFSIKKKIVFLSHHHCVPCRRSTVGIISKIHVFFLLYF